MAQYIRDVMTPNPVILSATSTLVEAAMAMRDFDVGAIIVLDDGRVYGIATDRDIVVRAIANGNYPATTKLGEVCSRKLATVAPSDTIDVAVRLMRDRAIRRLPVVENGQPVGIVSIGDLSSEREPYSPWLTSAMRLLIARESGCDCCLPCLGSMKGASEVPACPQIWCLASHEAAIYPLKA